MVISQSWLSAPMVIGVLLGLLLHTQAQANIRAPRRDWQGSSSVLRHSEALKTQGLEVQKEELHVSCTPSRCEVAAVYHIQSSDAPQVSLQFVLPKSTQVMASVNQQPATPHVSKLQHPTDMDAWAYRLDAFKELDSNHPLHAAQFEGQFQPGPNRVDVSYSQPLSTHELDQGYFREGRMVSRFQYEIWPLKEWTLSTSFQMTVRLKFDPQSPLNFWEQEGKPPIVMRCQWLSRNPDALFSPRMNTELQTTLHEHRREATLDLAPAQLPDRLRCDIGDRDLVTR